MEGIRMAFERKDPMAIFRGVQEINKMCGFYKVPTEKVGESGEELGKWFEAMSEAELLRMVSPASACLWRCSRRAAFGG